MRGPGRIDGSRRAGPQHGTDGQHDAGRQHGAGWPDTDHADTSRGRPTRQTRIVIFGNSGAGKSTLAKRLARIHAAAHLDLDTLAWEPEPPPTRRPLESSVGDLDAFVAEHPAWVIEGCYADLLAATLVHRPRMIFLNPGIDVCVANCRARPWEPHKYATAEEQDASLAFLIGWVRDYADREDEFSLASHRCLFEGYGGEKHELTSNEEAARLDG